LLLLLPPSETKRDGGVDGLALDLSMLGFPALTVPRRTAISALKKLSRGVSGSMAALGLGPTQRFEVERNRVLTVSPVMPALDRYTGVLFDGLDFASLSADERAFADGHVAIHSALFGVIRALDPIPAYRLSHNSRLPDLSLRRLWASPVRAVLAAEAGLTLDLRSESYVALGPAPQARYVRVVSENASGRRVALSHDNKRAKGEFARAVIASGIDHPDADSLLEWAALAGIRLEPGVAGELELIA